MKHCGEKMRGVLSRFDKEGEGRSHKLWVGGQFIGKKGGGQKWGNGGKTSYLQERSQARYKYKKKGDRSQTTVQHQGDALQVPKQLRGKPMKCLGHLDVI